MTKRVFALMVCVLIANVSAGCTASADEDWHNDVTVLTIAPDGSWGVATDAFVSRAIARAIADCKRRYRREIGCGHRLTSIRAGWSMALRCGNENIIVAEKSLADAEQLARRREDELRTVYVPDMPACVRTVTVDPHGAIVVPAAGYSAAP
jgi:hypothetical protein